MLDIHSYIWFFISFNIYQRIIPKIINLLLLFSTYKIVDNIYNSDHINGTIKTKYFDEYYPKLAVSILEFSRVNDLIFTGYLTHN